MKYLKGTLPDGTPEYCEVPDLAVCQKCGKQGDCLVTFMTPPAPTAHVMITCNCSTVQAYTDEPYIKEDIDKICKSWNQSPGRLK